MIISVPPVAGKVASAEWSSEGLDERPVRAEIPIPVEALSIAASNTYSQAGTYFTVLRAASRRLGNRKTPYAGVQNNARMRIVVN